MTTLPNMGLVLPTRGAPGSGLWADALDAIMALIDAHTHATGSGVKVTPTGLNINGDLTFAGNGATNLGKILFSAVTALTSGATALFVSSADNELYWRTQAGANVKLTNGASLNVAAFIGGIGGDYSTIEALLDYDDATDTYRFRQQVSAGVRQFAKIRAGDLSLYEYVAAGGAVVPSFAVTLKSPSALAASYALTMPPALPGSTQIVQVSSAGVLSASNTVANAATFSALVTADAGITCGANQHVTVSGTGRFKHGDMIRHISPITGGGAGWAWDAANGYLSSSGAGTWAIGIPTTVGETIKSLTFELYGDGAADLTGDVLKRAKASAVGPSLFSISVTNQPASYSDVACNFADQTIVDGDSMWITLTASSAGLRVGEIRVTYATA